MGLKIPLNKIEVTEPKNFEHGDYSTNIAMKVGNRKRFDWQQALVDLKMVKSKSEADRLLKQGGIDVRIIGKRHILARKGTQIGTIEFKK